MATTTTITKFLFRRGNDSDRKQTILASGEPGFTLDSKRLWIGDGVTPGGIPALSARDIHLHYVDRAPTTGGRYSDADEHNGGGAQFLDINIEGLSETLAGAPVTPDSAFRWFHPIDRTIEHDYDLTFRGHSANITHQGIGQFSIVKALSSDGATSNVINIGGKIIVHPEFTELLGPVRIGGSDLVFTGVDATHFSDKTIDINVMYSDGPKKDSPNEVGDGEDANSAGFYIAHKNWLSAGYMRVGSGTADVASRSSFEFAPPAYYENWEGNDSTYFWNGNAYSADYNYKENVTGRTPPSGKSSFTQDFEGIDLVFPQLSGQKAPTWSVSKPLVFKSTRPTDGHVDFRGQSYKGHAHLVFEAGLIVYDAGDPDTEAYNAYKINQSLDTRSTPTFTGIKIRKANSDENGDPIEVDSGGTGVNDFTTGSVLYTTNNHDDGTTDAPIKSMPLPQGSLMIGTQNKGVVSSKLSHSDWISFDYSDGAGSADGQSDGVIRVNNTFAPDYLKDNKNTRDQWFAKYSTFTSDTGQITAEGRSNNPSETVTFRGDFDSSYGGTIRTVTFGSTVDNRGVRFEHNDLASKMWGSVEGWTANYTRGQGVANMKVNTFYAGQTSSDRYFDELMPVTPEDDDSHTPNTYRNKGFALAGVTINQGGHVMGIRGKDFDKRYPQLFGMGTGGRFGQDLSPNNLSEVVHNPSSNGNAESYLPTSMKSASYNKNTRVMTGISFGDYGTVSSYVHHNLHDIFYDKTQLGTIVDVIDGRLDGIDTDLASLGGSSFLRNANTFTDRKIKTGWFSGSEIQFGAGNYSSSAAHNKIYASSTDWHFKPNTSSNTSFYIPTNKNMEWRKLTSQDSDANDTNDASQLMMKLSQSSSTTTLDIYEDGISRVSVNAGRLEVKNTSGSVMCKMSETGLTVNGAASFAQNLGVTGDIYVGSNAGGDSNIYFYDDNNNTNRTFQWDDSLNTWRVEDNSGTMRELLHTGNIASSVGGLKAADSNKLNGQLASFYATADHNHTYDVNNAWLRENGDNKNVKLFGNSRQMAFRTDGTTQYSGGIGSYPFVWMYGGDAASNRIMFLNTSGQLWLKNYGWLHDKFLPVAGGTITGNLTVNGTIYGKKDVVAYHSSDRSLKDNLKPIQNALSKTNTLTGYEFDWNDKQDTYTGHDVGVVAQEVEEILPEVVTEREDGTKAVKYEKIIPLLIESIKELSTQVEELKSQLK